MSRNILYLFHNSSAANNLPEDIVGHIYTYLPINTRLVLENNDLMRYIMSFNSCGWCRRQLSKNNTTVCSACYREMQYEEEEAAWYYGSEI
tara:strand:- start:37 stop:309 length:273 start_codon:yes stop_codon:yes gene_type:complete